VPTKSTREEGSVRVDLLGGTLDLNPINLILPNVVTLNLATTLKAKIEISQGPADGVVIVSRDYKREETFKKSDFIDTKTFGDFHFVAEILKHFGATSGITLTLESGSPPGAGLGGSSSMGVTLYKGLSHHFSKSFDRDRAIAIVNAIEARVLDIGPAGYQDYYPAVYGGVLALSAHPGRVEVEQLYSPELARALEARLTLVYSGQLRFSGINNWEVYKGFFDKNPRMREGLTTIAKLSHRALQAIKESNTEELLELIAEEGKARKELFPGIVSPEMDSLYNELRDTPGGMGLKVCGAGGGGCFLLIHAEEARSKVLSAVEKHKMTTLAFSVAEPMA
jgi:D-glycero-alpha-D-manno-heptose-7-phosphate kinase